jgi:anaerobic selenocysteine-containing dehydrogenase
MAAGGLYTFGGSFWEFGEPDWEHTQYLMLWGVAEDHDSNPIKLGLGKLKARGAKIVAVNPVRSGYGAIADEWIGIRPGTDGLFAFALIHELLRMDRIDLDYLVRYANAHWLVVRNPGCADDGLFARDAEGRPLCWDRGEKPYPHPNPPPQAAEGAEALADAINTSPAVVGEYTLADGRKAVPVFQLIAERYLDPQYAPDAVSERCGIPADTIRRIARELAQAAFDSNLKLPIAWTDAWGREHDEMVGRPVSMHAMRGISAHSNGFHSCRALHLLQLLLGAIDAPGSFRYQPPYPKPIPLPNRPGKTRKADGTLDAGPLGYVHGPEDLLVDEHGRPRRIDHAFSWAYPLSAHGMMHTVIRNAWAGDPYPIDTLLMFMANMSWNSAMNTGQTMQWLTDRDANGDYRIPHIIYSDAFASEMVAYADLVLPDTTYLERFDAISLLDRPISDADGAADAIRHPLFDPATQAGSDGRPRDVRGFQSVLLDLGARLGLPGMVHADGSPLYRDYADYIVRHERAPGVGLLAGWRLGISGSVSANPESVEGQAQDERPVEVHGKGAPNPQQLQRYIENNGFWREEIPEHARYFKMGNRGYLEWAKKLGFVGSTEPIVLQLYSEPLQKFRLAAQGHGAQQPPEEHRERVATYFDPLPIWYEPFEHDQTSRETFPLDAVTQRPMFMYHSWGSQNAWLRQITARNYLYLHPDTGAKHGIGDDDWIQVTSHHGSITVQAKFAGNVQPDTVWSWNAIGKRRGAWRLAKDAPEAEKGFLMNHLISDITPRGDYANADPVTGQAAWFDLRVDIRKLADRTASGRAAPEHAIPEQVVPDQTGQAQPQFAPLGFDEASGAPLRYGAALRSKAHGR